MFVTDIGHYYQKRALNYVAEWVYKQSQFSKLICDSQEQHRNDAVLLKPKKVRAQMLLLLWCLHTDCKPHTYLNSSDPNQTIDETMGQLNNILLIDFLC